METSAYAGGSPFPLVTAILGFSLLEVLLALAIAALMAVAGYRGLSMLSDSNQRLAEQSRNWRSLDRLFARLDADLRKAVPRGVRGPAGDEPAMWMADTIQSGLSATWLRFSRAGGESGSAGLAAGQRVEYRLHAHSLQLAYWPYLDNPPDSGPTTYTLLDGISAFQIMGYSPTGVWSAAWPVKDAQDLNALPRALRVEIRMDSGETIVRWFTLQP